MPKIAKTDYQLRLSVRPSILFSDLNGNTFMKIFGNLSRKMKFY